MHWHSSDTQKIINDAVLFEPILIYDTGIAQVQVQAKWPSALWKLN